MSDSTQIHRSAPPSVSSIVAALVAALAVVGLLQLAPLAAAYRNVERVDLDPAEFAPALQGDSPTPVENPAVADIGAVVIDERTTFLIIGTDERSGLEDLSNFGEFEGRRADVIMLAVIRPELPPVLLSIPRDLWASDPCGEGNAKINAALEGCGEARHGPSALAAVVESVTGVTVDHFVEVDLAGFPELVDLVGGYVICLENPVRDAKSGLDLPGGCTLASGAQTLAWVRSRSTEEFVDGRWRRMQGVNDLTRNARQRELMIDMFSRLKDAGPDDLRDLATAGADDLTLDRDLDLSRAVSLFQAVRSVEADSIRSLSIPVVDDMRAGAAVLIPTVDVEDWLTAQLEEQTVAQSPADPETGVG